MFHTIFYGPFHKDVYVLIQNMRLKHQYFPDTDISESLSFALHNSDPWGCSYNNSAILSMAYGTSFTYIKHISFEILGTL